VHLSKRKPREKQMWRLKRSNIQEPAVSSNNTAPINAKLVAVASNDAALTNAKLVAVASNNAAPANY
jgi:hypothetical protein